MEFIYAQSLKINFFETILIILNKPHLHRIYHNLLESCVNDDMWK